MRPFAVYSYPVLSLLCIVLRATFLEVAQATSSSAPSTQAIKAQEYAGAYGLQQASAPIQMVAYYGTYVSTERWWDIGSYRNGKTDYYNQYNAWLTKGKSNGQFNYAIRARNVYLTYERNPRVPYFIGHISAKGLKPNFAYQVKLVGKPTQGPRGTDKSAPHVLVSSRLKSGKPIVRTGIVAQGQRTPITAAPINGDDWTNQQLGYAGRWFNDSNPSVNPNSITDEDYERNTKDTVCGYLFIGVFVTDSKGDAECDISGDHSYHITWQGWQTGDKKVRLGTFSVSGHSINNTSTYYGYGLRRPSSRSPQANGKHKVTLFYELEWNRPNPVRLPKGTYHCRMMITEESFHNNWLPIGTKHPQGGNWKTVMATEAFQKGSSGRSVADTNPANDVVFTIS